MSRLILPCRSGLPLTHRQSQKSRGLMSDGKPKASCDPSGLWPILPTPTLHRMIFPAQRHCDICCHVLSQKQGAAAASAETAGAMLTDVQISVVKEAAKTLQESRKMLLKKKAGMVIDAECVALQEQCATELARLKNFIDITEPCVKYLNGKKACPNTGVLLKLFLAAPTIKLEAGPAAYMRLLDDEVTWICSAISKLGVPAGKDAGGAVVMGDTLAIVAVKVLCFAAPDPAPESITPSAFNLVVTALLVSRYRFQWVPSAIWVSPGRWGMTLRLAKPRSFAFQGRCRPWLSGRKLQSFKLC